MKNIEQNIDSKMKIVTISIVLILLVLVITIYIFYIRNNKDSKIQIEQNEKKYKLEVFKTEYNNNLCSNLQLSSCNKIAFEIPIKTENAKILSVAYDNYVLYLDEEIYLYNNDTKETKKIDITKNATNYS
ncbi:MAG: hypothetical protein K2H20_04555, partial [Bacilli bacterium]|nr:hypothetical protein [Bacilli bacterium]